MSECPGSGGRDWPPVVVDSECSDCEDARRDDGASYCADHQEERWQQSQAVRRKLFGKSEDINNSANRRQRSTD